MLRLTVLLFSASCSLAGLAQDRAHGAALYNGAATLKGRLAGHSTDMPPHVLACAKCHGDDARGPERIASSSSGLAPRLEGGWLGEVQSRRNGPPTSYDLPAFCRTLRTGIDPAQIQLPSRMPRFDLTDKECEHLWSYLNTPPAPAH